MSRDQVIYELGVDRVLSHQTLFRHRHPSRTPPFHREMITDWHGPAPRVLTMAFRGGAKSTVAEEALVIQGLYREFKNGLIVGSTYDLACERLAAVKHEFEANDEILELFGEMRGPIWTQDEIVLSNGRRILAKGRGQAMRGTKYLDQRPDACFVDDIEDTEDTRDTIKATKAWFRKVLLPALAPEARLRIAATPVHTLSLAESLTEAKGWLVRRYPIKHRDEDGEWSATWPERFPMETIEAIEDNFAAEGDMQGFNMEYMCLAEDDDGRSFTRDMMRVVPQARSWEPVYCMFDPARTTRTTSARTGFAAWSWIGSRLVVWEAWGRHLQPSEIIDAVFDANERFQPVAVGFEEDGLNEWALQPLRAAMVERGVLVPLRAMRAPRGKLDFIRALQPHYAARHVEHAADFPDLVEELIGFRPTAKMDVPNALAYCQLMRKGRPIFADFSGRHVQENLLTIAGPMWLALNAKAGITTGVLCQFVDGALRIHRDYMREGDTSETAQWILDDAQRDARGGLRLVGPPIHFDQHNNMGLRQALRPAELERGASPDRLDLGRAAIRDLLQREMRGLPALLIDSRCRWTTAALAGGYALKEAKGGVISSEAQDGMYRTLMEGLESLVGMSKAQSTFEQDRVTNAVTPGGLPYRSMIGSPQRTLRRG
jgi:hypothetical protein